MKNPDDHKQLEIDPDAAGTVRRVFRLAGEGQTTMQIARILNEEQNPTPMLYKRAAGCSRSVWPCVDEGNFWTKKRDAAAAKIGELEAKLKNTNEDGG